MIAHDSRWIRAPEGGTLIMKKDLGDEVEIGETIATLVGPLDPEESLVQATVRGLVVGRTMLSLLCQGEAIANIAHVDSAEDVDEKLDRFEANLEEEADLPA
jgi:predicted deacylase